MTTIIILSLIVIALVLLIILVFTFNTFSKDVKNAKSDAPTAKARWVLMYIDFQIYSKAYKTNLFP